MSYERPLLPAAARAVIDHDGLTAATAAYDSVRRLHVGAMEAASDADQVLADARERLESLTVKAAAGEAVSNAEIAKASAAERDASGVAIFRARVQVRTHARFQQAQIEFREAEELAKAPMVDWAIAHRIEAAKRLDQAKAKIEEHRKVFQAAQDRRQAQAYQKGDPVGRWEDNPEIVALDRAFPALRQELAAVEAEGAAMFEEAFAVLHDRGALRGGMPQWPNTSEKIERRFWNMPEPEPEPAEEMEAA